MSEIKARIGQAKTAFMELSNILTNQRLGFKVRKRVLDCYIEPVITYGSESWNINKQANNAINAAEMWFLRRMQKISYIERVTNKEVLERVGVKRSLMNNIRKRQARFFGHGMRIPIMEHLVTTGKIDGKGSRGRQREKMIDGLATWMNTDTPRKTLNSVWDRDGWKSMITDASRHGNK